MSNPNRRRLSASGVKNDSQVLSSSNVCSLSNHLNTEDSFLPDSDEGNESANTTNISDEAGLNDGFRFTNDNFKSRGLIDWKAFEDSLDCDGDLMGWCREMRSGQMEAILHQQLILKSQEEENQQQEALMKAKHKRELSDSHAEITALREENEQLRTALLKAQAEVSHIQTQLDKLKQEFMDQESVELRTKRTPYPLNEKLMDRRSPVGLTSHLESGRSGHCSTAKIMQSSRRCDKIPGSYMPAQRRILFLSSGLSDSESVLDPMSCDDMSESDGEAVMEFSHNTTELQTTLETVESPGNRSNMLYEHKPRPGPPIQPCRGASSCEDERSDPTYRLVLAGDVGSGKSSFLLRLSQHQFRENMRSTVGVDCQMKRMLVDGKKMALQIWDTAGQERFHSISRSYFRKANGILLLYDITSEKSFLNITQWLEQIEACTTTSVPLCLVGNKADLRGKVPNSLCVSSACGMRLATTCGALFFETSAKDGTNVVESVLHLAREVKKAGGVLTDSTLQLSSLGDGDSSAGNCCWVLA